MENEMRLPWRVGNGGVIYNCDGEIVAGCDIGDGHIARLIVASVNALKGWKVEQIEVVAEDGLEMFATWPDSQSNNERLVKANDTLTASNAKLRELIVLAIMELNSNGCPAKMMPVKSQMEQAIAAKEGG